MKGRQVEVHRRNQRLSRRGGGGGGGGGRGVGVREEGLLASEFADEVIDLSVGVLGGEEGVEEEGGGRGALGGDGVDHGEDEALDGEGDGGEGRDELTEGVEVVGVAGEEGRAKE